MCRIDSTHDYFEVVGSHGSILCELATGVPRHYFGEHGAEVDSYDGTVIAKFDIDEYKAVYRKLDASIDILDIGYWHADGYEPPAAEHRQMIAEGMRCLVG